MKKKILIAFLLLMAAVLSSVSCAPKLPQGQENTETTAPVESTEKIGETESETLPPEDPEKEIVLYEDGKWNYRIVTRAKRSEDEVDFSFELTTLINGAIGSAPHTANDTALKDETVPEIIIGGTRHPVMSSLYSSMGYGEAVIAVSGNKILLASYSAEGYDILLDHFKKLMRGKDKNSTLSFKVSELEGRFEANASLNAIPTADMDSFLCVQNCGYDQLLVIYENATKADFENYASLLKDHPRVAYSEQSENRFATYDFGDHLLNVSLSKGDNRLRIILNKNTEPTSLFQKPAEVKKVCEPLLIMHGLAWRQAGYTYYGYGMCYVIRLSDGRFIVIDGGFNRKKDADDLYALLEKYSVGHEKPTVAAWILTHAHVDHHGTFAYQFTANYRNAVTVENVIFNPPGGEILLEPSSETVSGLLNGQIVVNNAIRIFGAKNIRSHAGDRYYVGDAEIEILHTVDIQYPKKFDYYNTSSMILAITVAGQRIMITGDASNEAFGHAVAMYGADLKSDILQPAHHGGNTGVDSNSATSVAEGYKLMSPSVIIWPSSDEGYESSKKTMFNKALLGLSTVKKVAVAGDRDFIVELPYNP